MLFVLLLLLVVLLLVVVVAAAVVVVAVAVAVAAATRAAFSQSRSGRKSSNRWCFHVFLKLSEQKNMFFGLGGQKTRDLQCFLASA